MINDYNKKAYKEVAVVDKYSKATDIVGLWNSEMYAINKYFQKSDQILDIACGAGRTTYGMAKLGYENITGIDFSYSMIAEAKRKNSGHEKISFICCDVLNMPFESCSFNCVLISYNALMMIPKHCNRIKALHEIRRIIHKDGILVFTASDRERNKNYYKFWKDEKKRWENRTMDTRLFEYGDQIFTECGNDVFIHFSTQAEVKKMLNQTGFSLLESFFRSEFTEPQVVKEFSGDTMFYIAQSV